MKSDAALPCWKDRRGFRFVILSVELTMQGLRHLISESQYDMVPGTDGQPRPELFVADKLHFNSEGYKLLTARVKPYLPK